MPIWSEILTEISNTEVNGQLDFDRVRRKYLAELHSYTGRDVILYASAWLQKPDAPSSLTSLVSEDIQALMEVTYEMDCDELDLILHSPGGILEAAEGIVSYLRSRFKYVRVIVPQLAMSAATMVACSANEIVMGKHSFLGPIDPQILSGSRFVSAQAVLDQFDQAKEECKNTQNIAAWAPLLSQYTPGLLPHCESALKLSKDLVKTWLKTYMFANLQEYSNKAEDLSNWLGNHKNFNSHNRHLPRTIFQEKGFRIKELENDHFYQDLCLSVFHAVTILFTAAPAAKVIENHSGRAFIKHYNAPPPQQSGV